MRKLSLILACVIGVSCFAGCNSGLDVSKSTFDDKQLVDFNSFKDSEEIPDWQGDKLKLVKWVQASNTNASVNKTLISKNDPVSNEIERITGITYNTDESFDNGGGSFDSVIAKIITTDSFPHIAEGIPDVSSLVKNGYVWELGEYVKKYAPTIYKMFGPESKTLYGDAWRRQIKNYGGVYELAIGSSTIGLTDMVEKDQTYDLTQEQLRSIVGNGNSVYPYFYMRDDILKQLYPQAHSVKELKEIYNNNGKFTKEEILDVPIESPDDFVKMLYKIKDMNLKDGNAQVHAIFTHAGADNWPVLCQLGTMFRYHTSPSSANVNYFSYYDMKDNTIKPTFKQDWFKDILKLYNRLIRDGVASEEALVDTNNIFKEKLNNGRYIVAYGNYYPTESDLNGKYAYRKVYARYKINTEDYLYNSADYSKIRNLTFFKKSLNENQLIQTLRMIEFMASDAGQKLDFWGPKSAGYYTETEDGRLQYVDENIKNQMLNPTKYGSEDTTKYGLNRSWPVRIGLDANKYHPKLFYTSETQTWEREFDGALIEKHILTTSMPPHIYASDVLSSIPEAKKFWDARNGFEDAMLKIFVAANDEEFEALYKNMVDYAESNGLTNETFDKFTKYYKEDYNKEYMDYIYKEQASKD